MNKLIAVALLALSSALITAACAKTPCDAPSDSADGDAESDDPGCPAGLSCNEHGGCNSDYPYCCNGQCQKSACTSSEAP